MRALTRMRTLAAACALLLFVSGTAMAGLGNRFIDRPGTPEPPMVGDPDEPGGGSVTVVILNRVVILQLPHGMTLRWGTVQSTLAAKSPRRTQHAR
jgi:hypothetical protein